MLNSPSPVVVAGKSKPLEQPWRRTWPPTTPKTIGEKYSAKAGEELLVDGGGIVGNVLLQPPEGGEGDVLAVVKQ